MTKDEALKLALEALEASHFLIHGSETKGGLAFCMDGYYSGCFDIDSNDKQANEAITAIKEAFTQPEQDGECKHCTDGCPACDARKLPEQEPVAWMNDSTPSGIFARHMEGAKNFGCTIPLYTTPPQRTWVGLTDDDKVLIKHDANFNQFMTAGEYADRVQQLTEARLKDKNT